ncbi:DUF1345 domain-containing protein [Aquabacterium sp. OR-4]|uniref:DUF1345 domain-containing protein n=1 Tax=Aquabacterium sp. OR-4 TaxID=2978127 RepID=UPI0021B24F8F|nr:DUF1345 domain-containing protein [Aquabacterium sp. OR-4]MDT7835088.1 DUF1345 domain-containing protein [Aquabacterium sp. OR-4]
MGSRKPAQGSPHSGPRSTVRSNAPGHPAGTASGSPAGNPARRPRLATLLRSRPRLWWSAGSGLAVGLAAAAGLTGLPVQGAWATPFLLGWNSFALIYLALAWHLVHGASHEAVRQRAVSQHDGRHAVLALGVAAVLVALLAIASQLGAVRTLHGLARQAHLALAVLTVATAWLVTQALFALHYAHDFYVARLHGLPDPLQFPQTPDPDYGDFFYFACVIGTSGQTADVAFSTSRLRRVGALHCMQAWVFNATTLALGVNIAAGML